MKDTDQSQEQREKKEQKWRQRIEPGIVIGLVVVLVSSIGFYNNPSFEALIGILGGITTIFTFVSKERVRDKWILVGVLFVSAVLGIFYVRWVTDPEEIIIVGIFYDGTKDQEGDEYVVIRNEDMRVVQLEGWTLHDSQSKHVYTFPRYEMQPNEECRIFTNEDHSEWCGFNFRNGGSGVWDNIGGDMATLRNAEGVMIDSSIDLIMTPKGEVVQPSPEIAEIPTPTLPVDYDDGEIYSIEITKVFYNGEKGTHEPDEYVAIRNDGVEAIQLEGWTLRDESDHIFTFPIFKIATGQTCRIYTNEEQPDWCGFNYKSTSAIWGNSGDCATLRDEEGLIIDKTCYP